MGACSRPRSCKAPATGCWTARAEAIARTAGPFGAFGPELRAKTDQLAVVARFKFTREQVLQTQIQEPQ